MSLNAAPLIVQWDDNNPREIEEAKDFYRQARKEGRLIVGLDGTPIEHFRPALLGFKIEGRSLREGQLSARFFNETGDETLVWDMHDPDEVKEAAELFEKYLKRGFRAYAVNADGSMKRQITHFDPEVQEITFIEVKTKQRFTEKIKDFVAKFGAAPIQVLPPTYPG